MTGEVWSAGSTVQAVELATTSTQRSIGSEGSAGSEDLAEEGLALRVSWLLY